MGLYTLTYTLGLGLGPVIGGLLNDAVAPVAMWYGGFLLALAASVGFLALGRSPRLREAGSALPAAKPDFTTGAAAES